MAYYFELNDRILKYCEKHSSQQPSYLAEIERNTHLKTLQPRMISGEYQGRLLSLISKMIKPKTVLEIGTFTGYSALCLSEGMEIGGELHTIEVNKELTPLIDQSLANGRKDIDYILHIGNALEIIPTLSPTWDLVFIDAGKKDYLDYLNLIIDRCNVGGWIITDNVLWSGKVLELATDVETQILQEYNQALVNNPRLEVLMLPIRDGISILRKKE